VEPHADFTVEEKGGEYSITAGPGPGYAFKWYPDASKEAQTKDFDANGQLKLRVPDGKSQTVRLEVKNAFNRVTSKDFTIVRPATAPAPTTIQIREK